MVLIAVLSIMAMVIIHKDSRQTRDYLEVMETILKVKKQA